MTPKLRNLCEALDAELREVSRDDGADLGSLEMQLRIWLDEIVTVRQARQRKAEGRCRCGRRLEENGTCRHGCIQQ